jgi:NADPH:quinone reductase-like Zn-dependent oxidoreductase
MKVAYFEKYGSPDVVSISEAPKPKIKNNEILVKVVAAPVTAGDARIRGARFPKGFALPARLAFGVTKPRKKVLGMCFSGVVELVGPQVSNFKVGDDICGMTGIKMGTHAEYVVVKSTGSVAKKPKNISHEDASGLLFGGTAALFFLRDKAKVTNGDTVLINGASGAVGTNAVQIAKYLGGEVTAVTSSQNTKLVSSLGAKYIVDYTHEDILKSTNKYDVVLDAVGNISIKPGLKLLKLGGRLLLMVASLGQIVASSSKKQVLTGTATEKKEDIELLLKLLEKGDISVVIDKVYKFSDIAEAHRRVDSGNKTGNVIIKI